MKIGNISFFSLSSKIHRYEQISIQKFANGFLLVFCLKWEKIIYRFRSEHSLIISFNSHILSTFRAIFISGVALHFEILH